VYALTKNGANLESLTQEFPDKVIPITCDLSDWEETEKVLENIEPLDCLVNNAGVAFREDFFQCSAQVFDK